MTLQTKRETFHDGQLLVRSSFYFVVVLSVRSLEFWARKKNARGDMAFRSRKAMSEESRRQLRAQRSKNESMTAAIGN